jgi:hypothetical protein
VEVNTSHSYHNINSVILINFFYDGFRKDCSSNIFHKGTCIYLEEMLVQLGNKYNKHLYQWYSYEVKYSLHLAIIEPFKDCFHNL